MNQISLASVMMHLNMTKADKVDENMVRHMILNSLRMYRERFNEEYGELVICYDSKHYWRRDYFPQYKNNRKKPTSQWGARTRTPNHLQYASSKKFSRARNARG